MRFRTPATGRQASAAQCRSATWETCGLIQTEDNVPLCLHVFLLCWATTILTGVQEHYWVRQYDAVDALHC